MAGTRTPNISLYKPVFDEEGWDDEINGNFDTLDTEIQKRLIKPTPSGTGCMIYWNGSAWVPVVAPTAAGDGLVWNGSAWALLAAGAANRVLIGNGAGQIPSYAALVSSLMAVDANIAMGGHTLTGLPAATGNGQPVRYDEFVSQLSTKAPLASPALTGTPTAPTAPLGTNTTQIATAALVYASCGKSPYSASETVLKTITAAQFDTTSTTFVAATGHSYTIPSFVLPGSVVRVKISDHSSITAVRSAVSINSGAYTDHIFPSIDDNQPHEHTLDITVEGGDALQIGVRSVNGIHNAHIEPNSFKICGATWGVW